MRPSNSRNAKTTNNVNLLEGSASILQLLPKYDAVYIPEIDYAHEIGSTTTTYDLMALFSWTDTARSHATIYSSNFLNLREYLKSKSGETSAELKTESFTPNTLVYDRSQALQELVFEDVSECDNLMGGKDVFSVDRIYVIDKVAHLFIDEPTLYLTSMFNNLEKMVVTLRGS